MADLEQIKLPDNNVYNLADAEARQDIIGIKSTDAANGILYHLGLYLDENGGLCQVNSM